DDPLVAVGEAHGVQLPPVRLHHHRPRPLGVGRQAGEGAVRLPFGDVQLVNRDAGADGLRHGVAPLDAALGGVLPPRILSAMLSHVRLLTSQAGYWHKYSTAKAA